MGTPRPELRIGTSGYQYDHWVGVIYPEDVPKGQWFQHYIKHFDTVEINNTFYGLPEARTFEDWAERAPDDFLYILKFSRYGSHLKKLKNPEGTIGTFMERAGRLSSQLGPILVQLPPNWHADTDRLAAFLAAAPTEQRWAVEFRDPTWLCDEVYDILTQHDAALCVHDMIDDHPYLVTTDWVYLRYHGGGEEGNYPPEALREFAQNIRGHLEDGLDVYAYFNNDWNGYAVYNARELRACLKDE